MSAHVLHIGFDESAIIARAPLHWGARGIRSFAGENIQAPLRRAWALAAVGILLTLRNDSRYQR
jgi:hypothetical protein